MSARPDLSDLAASLSASMPLSRSSWHRRRRCLPTDRRFSRREGLLHETIQTIRRDPDRLWELRCLLGVRGGTRTPPRHPQRQHLPRWQVHRAGCASKRWLRASRCATGGLFWHHRRSRHRHEHRPRRLRRRHQPPRRLLPARQPRRTVGGRLHPGRRATHRHGCGALGLVQHQQRVVDRRILWQGAAGPRRQHGQHQRWSAGPARGAGLHDARRRPVFPPACLDGEPAHQPDHERALHALV